MCVRCGVWYKGKNYVSYWHTHKYLTEDKLPCVYVTPIVKIFKNSSHEKNTEFIFFFFIFFILFDEFYSGFWFFSYYPPPPPPLLLCSVFSFFLFRVYSQIIILFVETVKFIITIIILDPQTNVYYVKAHTNIIFVNYI